MFASSQMGLEVNLVVDEDQAEGALLLGVVGLQLWHGFIVATLDRQLESFLPDVFQLEKS